MKKWWVLVITLYTTLVLCVDAKAVTGWDSEKTIACPADASHVTTIIEVTDTRHFVDCDGCGIVFSEYHACSCTIPNVCKYCGAIGETIVNSSHNLVVEYAREYHWKVCTDCEFRSSGGVHWYPCTGEKVCAVCKQMDDIIIRASHVGEPPQYDENGHWRTCQICGEVPPEAHIFIDGMCSACGYKQPPLSPGDASGDGRVDIFDALAILQLDVGWDSDINLSAGDVNDDGKCDIFDALLILQYDVGWDVELK